MKNIYSTPEIDIIEVKASEVITTSGEFNLDDEDILQANMKNFLKVLSVALVLICVLSLSACKPKNQESDPEQTQAAGQTTAPTPTGFNLEDEDVLTDITATPVQTGTVSGTQAPTSTAKATHGAVSTPTPTLAPGQTAAPTQAPTNAPTVAVTQAPAEPTPTPNTGVTLPFDPFI